MGMQTPPRRSPGRPFAANRDAVERAALTLMLREGYEQVSVDDIAREAGIGRTTFFRYFKSKPGVVWSAFDDTISWLAENLTEKQEHPDILDAIRESIVFSTRSAIYKARCGSSASDCSTAAPNSVPTHTITGNDGPPRSRPSLLLVRDFLRRMPSPWQSPARPGACFSPNSETGLNTDDDREDILNRLDHNLRTVFTALRGLLAQPSGGTAQSTGASSRGQRSRVSRPSTSFLYDNNTVVTGTVPLLVNVVSGDFVTMYVEVSGSHTYSTTLGGETTVPKLNALMLDVTGSN
ncbi:TetR family transcriptional regulator [Rhodococcus opacus]|nr:TetR family transcriptional regulator [Rhodococcus opacus]